MRKRRMTVFALLVAMALGTLVAVVPASASVQGRRNTAAALTGLAAYELFRGHTGAGLAVGVGAAYAWERANEAREHRYYSPGYSYYPYGQGYTYYPYSQGYTYYPYSPGYTYVYPYPQGYTYYPYGTYGYSTRHHRDRDYDRDDYGYWHER